MSNIKKFNEEIRIVNNLISIQNSAATTTTISNYGAYYSYNNKPYYANSSITWELANCAITWDHISDHSIHINTTDRTNWNNAYNHSQSTHGWNLKVNTSSNIFINTLSGDIIDFKAGSDIKLSYSNNAITITNSNPDQIVSLTQNGTTTITGSYPNFTISSNDQYTGTVTSIATSGAILGGTITNSGTISHSNVSGYKHIPSGGTANQYLKYSSDGTAIWSNLPTTSTVNDGLLTLTTSGNGISGNETFTANQSGSSTFTINSNATSSNINNTIVYRDNNGNFIANIITAELNGNAATSSKWESGISFTLSGDITGSVSFDGSTNVIMSNTNIESNTITDIELNAGLGSYGQVLTLGNSNNISWTTPTNGTVTSIIAGSGMSFTTIQNSGYISMGIPESITSASTNSFNNNTSGHTHYLENYSVTSNKIASIAVTTDKIKNLAVSTNKINNLAITTNKIDDLAVITDKIGYLAVETDKIATSAVTTDKIDYLAVETDKIGYLAVKTDKIANSAITTGKIDDFSITTNKIINLAITADKIDIGAVETDRIAISAVTTDKIDDFSITTEKINPSTTNNQILKTISGNVTWSTLYLYSLSDVNINSPSNNEILTYNASTNKWENSTNGGGTTYYAGTGLSLSSNTFNHTNSVIASTASGGSGQLNNGSSFTTPTVTYDSEGHVTQKGTQTYTLPSYVGGTAISLIGTTFNHDNYINANTLSSPSSSPKRGDDILIPSITYNAQGHITATGLTSITLPSGCFSNLNIPYTCSDSGSAITFLSSCTYTTLIFDSDFTSCDLIVTNDSEINIDNDGYFQINFTASVKIPDSEFDYNFALFVNGSVNSNFISVCSNIVTDTSEVVTFAFSGIYEGNAEDILTIRYATSDKKNINGEVYSANFSIELINYM